MHSPAKWSPVMYGNNGILLPQWFNFLPWNPNWLWGIKTNFAKLVTWTLFMWQIDNNTCNRGLLGIWSTLYYLNSGIDNVHEGSCSDNVLKCKPCKDKGKMPQIFGLYNYCHCIIILIVIASYLYLHTVGVVILVYCLVHSLYLL